MLTASNLLFAQTSNVTYNWNSSRLGANGTQAVRHCIGRIYYNAVNWGDYNSIRFTLRQDYYTAGYMEYIITVRSSTPAIYCTKAYGAAVHRGRLVLGEQTSAGNSYLDQPNYYRDIFLEAEYYTQWQVEANAVGVHYQLDKFSLTNPADYQFVTFFSAPVTQNIPGFSPDIKTITLADDELGANRVGIGTLTPTGKLHIYKPAADGYGSLTIDGSTTAQRSITFNDNGQQAWWFGRDNNTAAGLNDGIGFWRANTGTALIIKDDGRVGIGCQNPQSDAKLAVNGTMYAKKIKVTQTGWADFVFEDSYKLPALSFVEKFVRINKHLPDIPSAGEVAEQGIDIGEMNKKLLQKIEELTLHLIDQNKRIDALEKENAVIKKKITKK